MSNQNPVLGDMAANIIARNSTGFATVDADLHRQSFVDFVTNKLDVDYHYDGPFTIAIVRSSKTGVVVTCGASKRNAEDPHLPIRGKSLALSRALFNFFKIYNFEVQKIRQAFD